MLSLEQMVENDYPIPSYMADLFQKPPGWVETPESPKESLLSSSHQKAKVYAIDCEMVSPTFFYLSFSLSVINKFVSA
jgi:RNA exonuclease 1